MTEQGDVDTTLFHGHSAHRFGREPVFRIKLKGGRLLDGHDDSRASRELEPTGARVFPRLLVGREGDVGAGEHVLELVGMDEIAPVKEIDFPAGDEMAGAGGVIEIDDLADGALGAWRFAEIPVREVFAFSREKMPIHG